MRQWIDLITESLSLEEALDTSANITWSDESAGGSFIYYAEMVVAGSSIVVKFSSVRGESYYDISFLRDGDIDLNARGNAFKVLGAVGKAICEFVDIRRPKNIIMLAATEELSRVKLYRKMIPMIAKQFPEYSMNERSTRKYVSFTFTKNGGPAPKATEYYGDPVTEYPKPDNGRSYSRRTIDDINDNDLIAMLNESVMMLDIQARRSHTD